VYVGVETALIQGMRASKRELCNAIDDALVAAALLSNGQGFPGLPLMCQVRRRAGI